MKNIDKNNIIGKKWPSVLALNIQMLELNRSNDN